MNRSIGIALIVLGIPTASGCETGAESFTTEPGSRRAPSSDTVEVAAGSVQLGFAIGVLRKQKDVGDFSISKFPITRGQFLRCVQAGACSKPEAPRCADGEVTQRLDHPTLDDDQLPDDAPATCVGVDQAVRYCRWERGRLPTFEEWMLAARGPQISRYSWGSEAPTCDRIARAADRQTGAPCAVTDPTAVQVGKHHAGAASSGLEDALLSRAELLATSSGSLFGACRAADKNAKDPDKNAPSSCLVFGLEAGAIDSAMSMPRAPEEPDGAAGKEVSPIPYGFRCAWGEEVSS